MSQRSGHLALTIQMYVSPQNDILIISIMKVINFGSFDIEVSFKDPNFNLGGTFEIN